MKKNLVLFASQTGNTEKVANVIHETFIEMGWDSKIFKYDMGLNPEKIDINFDEYDFICLGSPVYWYVPYDPFLWAIRKASHSDVYKVIEPGPKKGLAFSTYGGAHLGPREAEACLTILEITYEHLGFKSAGSISIPGRYPNRPTPEWYYPDLYLRPNNEDLTRVKDFVTKKVKDIE